MYSQIKVCVIDDDDEDIFLLEKVFKELRYQFKVNYIKTKEEILKYVSNLHLNKEEFPNLIILDLDIPGIHGTHVLVKLKDNENTRMIPIVIMSHSDLEVDIINCYSLHANGYLVKPQLFSDLKKSISAVCKYWFETVEQAIKGYNF